MELSNWIQLMIGIPLVGFVVSLFIPENREKLLSRVAFYTAGLNLLSIVVFLVTAYSVTLQFFRYVSESRTKFLTVFFVASIQQLVFSAPQSVMFLSRI